MVTIIGEILKACKAREKKGAQSFNGVGQKSDTKTMKYRQSPVQTQGQWKDFDLFSLL